MNKTRLIIAKGTREINDAHHIIDEVVIPSGVKSIGYQAFRGMEFTSIVIPDSVTKIGNYAFQNCHNLKSVRIPNGVKSIGNGAFCGCDSLEEIFIPSSVTYIGFETFYYSDSLEAIYIDKERDSLDLKYADIPETTKIYWKGEF